MHFENVNTLPSGFSWISCFRRETSRMIENQVDWEGRKEPEKTPENATVPAYWHYLTKPWPTWGRNGKKKKRVQLSDQLIVNQLITIFQNLLRKGSSTGHFWIFAADEWSAIDLKTFTLISCRSG